MDEEERPHYDICEETNRLYEESKFFKYSYGRESWHRYYRGTGEEGSDSDEDTRCKSCDSIFKKGEIFIKWGYPYCFECTESVAE